MSDTDRPIVVDESDDGSFMDRPVPRFSDGRDPLDTGKPKRRLPRVPASDDAEGDVYYND